MDKRLFLVFLIGLTEYDIDDNSTKMSTVSNNFLFTTLGP
jgi:hypothetical protein